MQNYGIKEFHFHDDSYLCDPKRAMAISEGMIKRGLKVYWQASQGVTVWGLKPQMLPIMKESGMYRLGLPIETGSQKTLKLIKKVAHVIYKKHVFFFSFFVHFLNPFLTKYENTPLN